MSKTKLTPAKELIDKIYEIARIKQEISLRERSVTSVFGLFVQSKTLPSKAMVIAAGGRYVPNLVLTFQSDGSHEVNKYKPGDWENNIDITLALCRGITTIPSKEVVEEAYDMISNAPFDNINLDLVRNVELINKKYYQEINSNWHKKGGRNMAAECFFIFLSTLRKQPLKEDKSLLMIAAKNPNTIYKSMCDCAVRAYIIGYLFGKQWISIEEETSALAYCANNIVTAFCQSDRKVVVDWSAFFFPLAQVAVKGVVDATNE